MIGAAVLFWVLVFVASLALMVKSADWFVDSAEKLGLALKIPPFVVGVVIVAVGTSFPELISALFAVFKNATEMVTANVIGSNIANILLIIGVAAVLARHLRVERSLIDLDSPLLATSTALFLFICLDGKIVWEEALILLVAFVVYFLYTVFQRPHIEDKEITKEIGSEVETLPARHNRRKKKEEKTGLVEKFGFREAIILIGAAVGLAVGADYTVESVIRLSKFFGVATSLITITAVAVGTSLPELLVSAQAALKRKYEIAIGNIFGSNVFNFLLIGGVSGLFHTLAVDSLTMTVGLPFLAVATFLFVISGISRSIHAWEGIMYLLIYILFIIKLIGLF